MTTDVRTMSDGVLLGSLLLGEKLLRNGTHWANQNQRDEVEKRVQELRDEWDRREDTSASHDRYADQ